MILYAAFHSSSNSSRISLISLMARMLIFISPHAGCYNQAHNFHLTIKRVGTDMADDRDRNQGMKEGGAGMGAGQQGGQGGAHEAPGRNPGTGQKEAGDKGNLGGQQGGQQKKDKEGGFKEGGQNEQTRR